MFSFRYGPLGLLLWLLPLLAAAQSKYSFRNDDVVLLRRFNTVAFTRIDFDSVLVAGRTINKGQEMRHVAETPLIRSVRYGLALIDSEKAYEAGDFVQSARLLETAAQREPDNPFITYQLARALYRTDATKPRSHTLYRRLVSQLDGAMPPNDSTVVVDMGFVEAYWKLGTLQMDNEQWPDAILNISRFVLGAQSLDYLDASIHEQALGYLAECFFMVRDADMCRYFGQRTLKLYPRNQYVREYLTALPKPAAAKPRTPAPKPKAPIRKK